MGCERPVNIPLSPHPFISRDGALGRDLSFYAAQVHEVTSTPDEVLNKLDDVVSKYVPVNVLFAALFPAKRDNGEAPGKLLRLASYGHTAKKTAELAKIGKETVRTHLEIAPRHPARLHTVRGIRRDGVQPLNSRLLEQDWAAS